MGQWSLVEVNIMILMKPVTHNQVFNVANEWLSPSHLGKMIFKHSLFLIKSEWNTMRRLLLNLSTTAGVVLFTMGALSMIESQNDMMAGVFLLFAFWLPAHDELITLLRRKTGLGKDSDADSEVSI